MWAYFIGVMAFAKAKNGPIGATSNQDDRIAEIEAIKKDLEGKESTRSFEGPVIAGPRISVNSLSPELLFSGDAVYTVGDVISPRNVCDAVHVVFKS